MANEHVKVELTNSTGFPRDFTCADGTAIAKGALLKLTDPRTCIASVAEGEFTAGVASVDKVASDGQTFIPLWTDGIFKATASGSITAGQPVANAGSNKVELMTSATASGAIQIGYALETATNGETFLYRLRL